jgi:cytochrome c-type biogenesis protein
MMRFRARRDRWSARLGALRPARVVGQWGVDRGRALVAFPWRLALVITALALAACARSDAPAVATLGERAPAYTATSLDGGLVSLADYRGKVVLLNVWATWCAPCREEIPFLNTLHDAHATNGLAIVGVSVDASGSDATIREFRSDFKMEYPIWLDPDERVQSTFLALGVPASYLIDREGILRWRHLGTLRAGDSTFTDALRDALGDG